MDARASRYHDVYARWQRDPEGFWGEAAQADRLVRAAEESLRQGRRHLRPLVHRRRLQHLLQRARPPRARRPQRPGGADLRFPRHQHQADLHLRPHAVGGAIARRHAARLRRQEGRRRHPLHADGAGGGVRACWPARASAPCIRWCSAVSRPRSSPPASTTAKPKVDPVGQLRHRGRPRHPLQAAARRGDQTRQAQAADLPDPAAPAMRGDAGRRPRPRLAQNLGARGRIRQDLRMRAGARHRPALHPLHLRHHRHPQGRGARQWRPHGRAQMVDAISLRRQSRRSVVVGLRRRLGGRPLLHRLRAAVPRLHLDPLRGQAGRHARRRRLLARLRRPRRGLAVHRADRLPRHPQGGPGGETAQAIRPVANSARCSSPASAPTRRPSNGPSSI